MRVRAWLVAVTALGGCRLHFDPKEFDTCAYAADSAARLFRWAENDHCYSFHPGAIPRGQKASACASFGAHMVTFGSRGEHEAVLDELAPEVTAWIGLIDANNNPRWETGEPMPYTAWAAGQPGFGEGAMDPDGTWRTLDGEDVALLCESSVVVTSDRVYVLDYAPLSWDVADAKCRARGGHLATLGSPEEVLVVAPLIANARWLGGRETATADVFAWTTDEPFTFTNFAAGEPGSAVAGCLGATDKGWMEDDCAAMHSHVCELE